MTLVAGQPWQEVLGHRVELADPPTGTVEGIWNLSTWGGALWAEGWSGTFRDVTPDVLHVHTQVGAYGLEVAAGVGSIEVELLNLEGAYAPDVLLGRHLRGIVTPQGRPPVSAFYGVIDRAAAGGTFAVPTVKLTAYDVRSLLGSAASATAIAGQAEPAATRLRNILDAGGIPRNRQVIETDPTTLLADDTTDLGDLWTRTVESAAGLAWADGQGRIVYRGRDWTSGTATAYSLVLYAGEPPSPPPGVTVVQTTGDLDATQANSTVRNLVRYANRNDPVEEVTVLDQESIGRYGYRKSDTGDLASPLELLTILAARELNLWKDPRLIVEGATVTVYDPDTARAAALELGNMVILGRNDPGAGTVWEVSGIVAGLELTIDPDRFDISVTVVEIGTVGGVPAVWDLALWGVDRWQSPAALTKVWTMGPHANDRLNDGNAMGPLRGVWTMGPDAHDKLDAGNTMG